MKKTKLTPKEQSAAYGKAESKLREAHRDEFNKLLKTEYAAAGDPDWEPRKTAAEKEIARIEEQFAKLPDFKALFAKHFLDEAEASVALDRDQTHVIEGPTGYPTIEGQPWDPESAKWDGGEQHG